jgi:hypothetical protein
MYRSIKKTNKKQTIRFVSSILSIGFLVLLFSCSKTANIIIEEGDQQIVFNSILDATKDTIWVELSRSQPITKKFTRTAIENGTVYLMQNNVLIDTFSYSKDGNYYDIRTPIAFEEYTIIAIAGFDTLSASTIVPPIPNIEIEAMNTPCNHYVANITTNTNENFYYWISSSKVVTEDNGTTREIFDYGIYAEGFLFDDFNRSSDSFCSMPFFYEYYLRILNGEKSRRDTVRFTTGSLMQNEIAEIKLFATDINYDRFIRSSILGAWAESIASETPLSSNPVIYYSNIKGGIGLVGSINSKTQYFHYE